MTTTRRLAALLGGLVVGVGLDQVEGPDTRSGYLVLGLGVGVLVAALVREP